MGVINTPHAKDEPRAAVPRGPLRPLAAAKSARPARGGAPGAPAMLGESEKQLFREIHSARRKGESVMDSFLRNSVDIASDQGGARRKKQPLSAVPEDGEWRVMFTPQPQALGMRSRPARPASERPGAAGAAAGGRPPDIQPLRSEEGAARRLDGRRKARPAPSLASLRVGPAPAPEASSDLQRASALVESAASEVQRYLAARGGGGLMAGRALRERAAAAVGSARGGSYETYGRKAHAIGGHEPDLGRASSDPPWATDPSPERRRAAGRRGEGGGGGAGGAGSDPSPKRAPRRPSAAPPPRGRAHSRPDKGDREREREREREVHGRGGEANRALPPEPEDYVNYWGGEEGAGEMPGEYEQDYYNDFSTLVKRDTDADTNALFWTREEGGEAEGGDVSYPPTAITSRMGSEEYREWVERMDRLEKTLREEKRIRQQTQEQLSALQEAVKQRQGRPVFGVGGSL